MSKKKTSQTALPVKKKLDENAIDPKMHQLLVCPLSKKSLELSEDCSELKSISARLAYPVRGGIPILLPSEARALEDDEL